MENKPKTGKGGNQGACDNEHASKEIGGSPPKVQCNAQKIICPFRGRARGSREKVEEFMEQLNLVFYELLPLSLERKLAVVLQKSSAMPKK